MSTNYLYEKHSDSEKRLKVYLQRVVTTYLNYNLPLCAILWNKKKESWLYEHFTQIYCMESDNGYLWVDYLEDLYFPNEVAEYFFKDSSEMGKISNIVKYIKNKISEGYYIMIFVDSFHIKNSNKCTYLKKHDPLQLFIYGYNDTVGKFNGIGFTKKSSFGLLSYSYDNIQKAFDSCKNLHKKSPIWVKLYNCVLIKMKNPISIYRFKLPRFMIDLERYIFSLGDRTLLRPEIRISKGEEAFYGLNVYQKLIKHLRNFLSNEVSMDYRYVHLFAEQKKLLLKKFKYINMKYDMNYTFRKNIDEYNDLVNNIEDVKNLYLKHVIYLKHILGENIRGLSGPIKDHELTKKIIDVLDRDKMREKKILMDMYECLKRKTSSFN